jgi:diguanylate cyclase (GGDEF)-like protein
VCNQGRVIAAICVQLHRPDHSLVNPTGIDLLQIALAQTLARIRLAAEARLLHEMSHGLGSRREVAQLMRQVLELVAATFATRVSQIFLLDRRAGDLTMMLVAGEPSDHPRRPGTSEGNRGDDPLVSGGSGLPLATARVPLHDTASGWVVTNGAPLIHNATSDSVFADASGAKLACVPLKHNDHTIGALMLANNADDPDFLDDDLHLLMTCAGVVAMLIANARLYERAVRDALTGAYNRGTFDARLREYWAAWEQSGTGFALLMLDLDDFKQVNDQFGHAAGDAVLRETTRLLWSGLREEDALFRYGGEEFCVVLGGVTGLEAAERAAERLRTSLDREIIIDPAVRVRLSASIGLAMHPLHGARTPQDLLDIADEAAMRAKQSGKNRVLFGSASREARA